MKRSHGTQVQGIGIWIFGQFLARPLHLGAFNARHQGADDVCSHLVLQSEDVAELTLVTICPDVVARFGVHELADDAHAAASLPYTSPENVSDTKFAPDLPDIDQPPFVGERGVARDDKERREPTQGCDDLCDDPSAKYSCSRSTLRF